MASRGRLSLGCFLSKNGSTRSAQPAAQSAKACWSSFPGRLSCLAFIGPFSGQRPSSMPEVREKRGYPHLEWLDAPHDTHLHKVWGCQSSLLFLVLYAGKGYLPNSRAV
jgi:hypothetical protein